jgi:Fe-S cluster assembly iron-binding protein IscA
MLMVTDNARQAIESIVQNAGMPEGAGIRIDAPDEPPAPSATGAPLQLEVAPQPAEQDQVVASDGARVFIAPSVAPVLEDKLLDVRVGEGHVEFLIRPQGAPGDQQGTSSDQQGTPGDEPDMPA